MFFFNTLLILDVKSYLLTCGGCVLLSFLLGYFYNNWERQRTQRRQVEEKEAIKREVVRQFRAPFHERDETVLSCKVKAEIIAILERSEAS